MFIIFFLPPYQHLHFILICFKSGRVFVQCSSEALCHYDDLGKREK